MNILLYNYAQPLAGGTAGGGVSVYLRNLVPELRADGHVVYTMSAGTSYDWITSSPTLIRRESQLVIRNSPNTAPNLYSFHHPEIYTQSTALDSIPQQMRRSIGPLDVLHFHNLEGLTLGFFRALREAYPEAAIIFTAHNYGLICNQINLWHAGIGTCEDFEQGHRCTRCATVPDRRAQRIALCRVEPLLHERPRVRRLLAAPARVLRRLESSAEPGMSAAPRIYPNDHAESYATLRQGNLELTRAVFDSVIAVSERTRAILTQAGVAENRCHTLYIGTRHQERFATATKKVPSAGRLHVGYLGYAKRDKGFFLFLQSLDMLPEDAARNMEVTIAARIADHRLRRQLEALSRRVRSLRLFDGYDHAQLPDILAPVNLGIVPPLWEDCLPQVAIEWLAHGVPIACSDRGGAGELCGNPDLRFAVDSAQPLAQLLLRIHRSGLRIEEAWGRPPRLHSNQQHAQALLDVYRSLHALRQPAAPIDDGA